MKLSARQVEVFLAVMETRTLSQAAERLAVAQPAVSRMLARFQDEVGFKAFEKRGTRLVATAAAEIFYTEVKRYYSGIEHLDSIARELKTDRRGFLKIGILPALSNEWIMSRIKGFFHDHDKIQVSIEPRSSRKLIDLVAAQILDVAITAIPTTSPEVSCSLLSTRSGVCLLPAGHPLLEKDVITATDLAGQDFISLSTIDGMKGNIDQVFESQNIERNIRLVVAQGSSACHAVGQGLGITILPHYLADEYRYLGYETRPFEPDVKFSCYLLKSTQKPFSSLVEAFVTNLREQVQI